MKKRVFIFFTLLCGCPIFSQEKKDSLKSIQEIIILGKAPISKERITQKQFESKNLGQDIPTLLKNNISVVSTSDAGAGIGYSKIRIRGTDQSQINITLNGVPVNDAESQGAFWVNMPDLSSSLSSFTIQRGVGTSTEGTGSFGASISMRTQSPSDSTYFQTNQSVGSFHTHKHTFGLGTGYLLNNNLKIDGRISFIKSDGYIDRAASDLFSFYAYGIYHKNNTQIGFMSFGGNEKTYQAWNGIDNETMSINRTLNSCGAIYDSNGKILKYYNNETDNYKQNHYHLYLKQPLNDYWKFNSTLFYTQGKGYYEEYSQEAVLENYKLQNISIGDQIITNTDLIRQQGMDNHFYGIINQLSGNFNRWALEAGLGANIYNGKHTGKVIWAEYFSNGEKNHEYYNNTAKKNEISGYIKALYKLNNYLEFFGDVQYRNIRYRGKDTPNGESIFKNGGYLYFSKNYNFINPKVGASYKRNKSNLYLTYGIAQREPNRDDILSNKNIKSEVLHNIELRFQEKLNQFSYSTNWYGMYYINQLVLSGRIDNVGNSIRENSGKSFRTGIEISGQYQFSPKFEISTNSIFSINKNLNFKKEVNSIVENLGATTIAFSPTYIGNLILAWVPIKNISAKWFNQYISSQYLSNEKPENGKLKGYFTSDLVFEYNPKLFNFKKISLKLLLNNILDNTYESNGYYYEDTPYYYPQAGFNFLTGINITF